MTYSNAIVTAPTSDLEERIRCGIRMTIESLASRYASPAADGNVETAVLGDAARRLALQLGNYPVPTVALSAINMVALLTSAARTATTASADQLNTGAGNVARGVVVVVNITSIGTGSITASIQRKNLDGSYTNIVTSGALVTGTKAILLLDPLVGTQTAGTEFDGTPTDGILPQTWRVNVVANNANSVTYSVGAYLIR